MGIAHSWIVNISDVSTRVPDGLRLDLQASPRSNRTGFDGFDEWRRRLNIRVKAPPLEGKANSEIERQVQDMTGCKTEVIAGHTTRQKTVMIYGDPDSIVRSLEGFL